MIARRGATAAGDGARAWPGLAAPAAAAAALRLSVCGAARSPCAARSQPGAAAASAAAAAAAAAAHYPLRAGCAQQARRLVAAAAGGSGGSAAAVDVERAMAMLQREGAKVVDTRPPKAFEDSRITKPVRVSLSCPWEGDAAAFVAKVKAAAPSPAAKLLVMSADGGADAAAAAAALAAAGYTAAAVMEGGFAGWSQVWSPSGKRRPPPGRWVPTGKEALKAATNIPGAAESYEEGGNLTKARWAQGLPEGETLLPPLEGKKRSE